MLVDDKNASPSKKGQSPLAPTMITQDEVDSAPKVALEVLESPTLPKGARFIINAAGYMESKRGAKDGCVYMGTSDHNETTGETPNDIVVPSDEIGMGGVHLVVQYKPEKKGYFMRDCGQGTGTFIKVEQPLILKQGYIISYGDSHMYVNMENKEKIQLKFLDGPKSDQML